MVGFAPQLLPWPHRKLRHLLWICAGLQVHASQLGATGVVRGKIDLGTLGFNQQLSLVLLMFAGDCPTSSMKLGFHYEFMRFSRGYDW